MPFLLSSLQALSGASFDSFSDSHFFKKFVASLPFIIVISYTKMDICIFKYLSMYRYILNDLSNKFLLVVHI